MRNVVVAYVAIAVLFPSLAVNASDEELFSFTVKEQYGNRVAYVTKLRNPFFSGDISIPSTLGGYPVVYIDNGAFFNSSITSVIIPDTVTGIGRSAFYGCRSMTNATIGTAVETISERAFDGCSSLVKVVMPESLTIIGSEAFSGCQSLTNVIIPERVTAVGLYAFSLCTALISVNILGANTIISYNAFASCFSLTKIEVAHVNIYYSSIDGVLFDKDATTLIQCPSGKIGYYCVPDCVTTIGDRAFNQCAKLTSISIPDSVVKISGHPFSECDGLVNLSIGNGITSLQSDLIRALFNLATVTIGSSVTNIELNAFFDVPRLERLLFNGPPPSMEAPELFVYGEQDLYYRESFRVYYLPGVPGWGATYGGLPTELMPYQNLTYSFENNAINIIAYTGSDEALSIPGSIYGYPVTSIGDEAFWNCYTLTNVTIPGSVTNIGIGAFMNCCSLASITIPSSVVRVNNAAFAYCASLNKASISKNTALGTGVFAGDSVKITRRSR